MFSCFGVLRASYKNTIPYRVNVGVYYDGACVGPVGRAGGSPRRRRLTIITRVASGPRLFVRFRDGRARARGQVVFDGAEERRGRLLYAAQQRFVCASADAAVAVSRARGRPVQSHGRRAIAIRPERVVGDAQVDAVDGETDRGDRARGTVLDDGVACSADVGAVAARAVNARAVYERPVAAGRLAGGRRPGRQDAQVERAD